MHLTQASRISQSLAPSRNDATPDITNRSHMLERTSGAFASIERANPFHSDIKTDQGFQTIPTEISKENVTRLDKLLPPCALVARDKGKDIKNQLTFPKSPAFVNERGARGEAIEVTETLDFCR